MIVGSRRRLAATASIEIDEESSPGNPANLAGCNKYLHCARNESQEGEAQQKLK